jgi:pimeloyl-ACP methyl ester carboxylesterase
VVISSGSLALAAWEGPVNGPTIVFVHGYPDTHSVWHRVIDRLADQFHCVAYDVRGAGASAAPDTTAGYRTRELIDDLVGVLDRFAPDRPVHLVGHDWGSVQLWDVVLSEPVDRRLTDRLASFTSISGPGIDIVGSFAKEALGGSSAMRRQALRQAARSSYAFAFLLPVLPELALRSVIPRLLARSARRAGRPAHFAETLAEDAANGVRLYRANLGRSRTGFHRLASTSLPVQLLVPLEDPYVSPALARHAESFATALKTVELAAGHWVQLTHPDEIAACLHSFIGAVELSRRPHRPPG